MRHRTVLGVVLALAVLPGASAAAKQNLHDTCGNTTVNLTPDDVVYGGVNNNGSGKIGPRRLVVGQSGTITSSTSRLFKGFTPWDIDTATLKLKKTGGKGRTTVAICATETGAKNRQTLLSSFEIPNGKDSIGTTWTRTLRGIKDRRLSVRLKGKSVANSMSYTLTVARPNAGEIWEPTRQQLNGTYRAVPGFADLHVHHAGRFAFASGWYFGPMDGALPPDPLEHCRALSVRLVGVPLTTLREEHCGETVPNWDDTSHQQTNSNALKAAHDNGLNLMVAPAVNNEWFCSVLVFAGTTSPDRSCVDMEAAKYQILQMKRFDEDHDWYQIVTNPWEAREAIQAGRLAVVLGVEVSDLMPASDGDWKRQLDELYDMGVRVIYLAHESNSRFAGAAYHHTEALALPNQLTAWFSKDIKYASKPNGKRNAVGLSATGRDLVGEMMRRHMLIDVDHVSWKGVDAIANETIKSRYYPVYAGHSRVSDLLTDAQKQITPELNTPPRVFRYIRESGGLIGIRTGPDAMKHHPSAPANTCDGSSRSLAQTYVNIIDRGAVATFGSDFNGFVTELGPRFGPDACPAAKKANRTRQTQKAKQQLPNLAGAPPSWTRYQTRGMSDIGTEPAVVFDLKALGVNTGPLERSAEAYLDMWMRTYDPNRGRIPEGIGMVPELGLPVSRGNLTVGQTIPATIVR